MSAFDVRPMRPDDVPAVRALRERCGLPAACGEPCADTRVARAWVLDHGGRIVAHCASSPSRVWVGGEERVFAVVTLPAVDEQQRAEIERVDAEARLAAGSVEAHLAPGRDLGLQALVPAREWRRMERLFGLEIARTPTSLRLALDGHARPDAADLHGCAELDGFDEQVRWLWDRCADGFGLSAIRDAAWLEQRFAGDTATRHVGVCDAGGVLRGYAAFRGGAGPRARDAALVEWLVPPHEQDVGRRLLAGCAARARHAGAEALCAFLASWSPWYATFQRWGARVGPTDWLLAARSSASRYDAFWLRDNWWWQPADFAALGTAPPDLLAPPEAPSGARTGQTG